MRHCSSISSQKLKRMQKVQGTQDFDPFYSNFQGLLTLQKKAQSQALSWDRGILKLRGTRPCKGTCHVRCATQWVHLSPPKNTKLLNCSDPDCPKKHVHITCQTCNFHAQHLWQTPILQRPPTRIRGYAGHGPDQGWASCFVGCHV